jgi:hypothetical protein
MLERIGFVRSNVAAPRMGSRPSPSRDIPECSPTPGTPRAAAIGLGAARKTPSGRPQPIGPIATSSPTDALRACRPTLRAGVTPGQTHPWRTDRPTRGRETQRMGTHVGSKLPTASMMGLLAGSAPPASRPCGPYGAALRAGLDPSSVTALSTADVCAGSACRMHRCP